MPEATDLATGYRAFRDQVGAVWLDRNFVRASGPDALTFLQGQLSQDVRLDIGASAWALLLQPQGKVVALLRVLREGEESFVLDTDVGFGAAVTERLNRFKLRTRCDFEPLSWQCLALRGPAASKLVADTRGGHVVVADWPGLPGADLVGEAPEVPDGVPVCSLDAYEVVRIEAGIPVMGRELDEGTIPAEAGVVVEQSVSFTKGCYTGQELVARVDSRGGNVPKHLRGVVVVSGDQPPAGATVRAGDRNVGTVTSVAYSPGLGTPVALAYVGRAVTPPADVELQWDGGVAAARVQALPLVG